MCPSHILARLCVCVCVCVFVSACLYVSCALGVCVCVCVLCAGCDAPRHTQGGRGGSGDACRRSAVLSTGHRAVAHTKTLVSQTQVRFEGPDSIAACSWECHRCAETVFSYIVCCSRLSAHVVAINAFLLYSLRVVSLNLKHRMLML